MDNTVMTRTALLTLSVLALGVLASGAQARDADNLPTVSPREHEAVKASVIDPDPSQFTIDVKKLTNMGVDEEAPTFAVYVTRRLPDTCGDFRKLEIPYVKPDKYKRRFDLTRHQDVIRAIDAYGCVVMRNIPSKG